MDPESPNLTELLLAWGAGDANALDALTPLVYDHLHRLARHYMAGERPGRTLQATALVNRLTCDWWTPAACGGRTAPTSLRWRPN